MIPLSLAQLGFRLMRLLAPETAHRATLRALAWGLGPRMDAPDDPILRARLWGREFSNPIGLAAGFDKNAEALDALARMGFGFIEAGGVTPRAQPGNPRPRLFRLERDRAIINRMGFNNEGMAALAARLARYRGAVPVGVNLGANKDSADRAQDYAILAERLAPLATFITINVSSPNTPGLRALQSRAALDDILTRTRAAMGKVEARLLLKIAPDLTDEDCADIADIARAHRLDGLVVANTTIAREGLRSPHAHEAGGLSGAPLMARSTQLLGDFYATLGRDIPLIGVGGIQTGADAYAKIRAGATLVQLYSALAYDGPALIPRIKRELAECLRRDGFASVNDAVGAG